MWVLYPINMDDYKTMQRDELIKENIQKFLMLGDLCDRLQAILRDLQDFRDGDLDWETE